MMVITSVSCIRKASFIKIMQPGNLLVKLRCLESPDGYQLIHGSENCCIEVIGLKLMVKSLLHGGPQLDSVITAMMLVILRLSKLT